MIAWSEVERTIGEVYYVNRIRVDDNHLVASCRGRAIRLATEQEYWAQCQEIGIYDDGRTHGPRPYFYEVAVD